MSTDTRNEPRLSGIFAPTVTAFNSDESLSPQGTRAFVRFLLEQGVDGLTPLGSAGEPVALSTAERMKALDAIVGEVGGRIPIYAGTSDYSTATTIELSLHAKSIGCDGLMLMAPYLLKPPKEDVLNHFRRVREKVGLPIMVYNVPVLTGIEITPEEIRMLAEEDVVHAVKWSHMEDCQGAGHAAAVRTGVFNFRRHRHHCVCRIGNWRRRLDWRTADDCALSCCEAASAVDGGEESGRGAGFVAAPASDHST